MSILIAHEPGVRTHISSLTRNLQYAGDSFTLPKTLFYALCSAPYLIKPCNMSSPPVYVPRKKIPRRATNVSERTDCQLTTYRLSLSRLDGPFPILPCNTPRNDGYPLIACPLRFCKKSFFGACQRGPTTEIILFSGVKQRSRTPKMRLYFFAPFAGGGGTSPFPRPISGQLCRLSSV